MPHPLARLVADLLPLRNAAGHEVVQSFDDPDTTSDDMTLIVALCVLEVEDDGEPRGMMQQLVTLITPEHTGHPVLADYLRASLAEIPAMLRADGLHLPSNLFFPELLAEQSPDFSKLADKSWRDATRTTRDDLERRESYASAIGDNLADALLALRRPRYLLTSEPLDEADDGDTDDSNDTVDDDTDDSTDDDTDTDDKPHRPNDTVTNDTLVEPGHTVAPADTDTNDSSPPIDPGPSHLGGHPELPPDFPWPRFGADDLVFLAQLDLAALPGLTGPDADLLPRTGLLSVFLALHGGEHPAHGPGVVHWFPDRAALVRTAPPDPTLTQPTHKLSAELTDPTLPGWEQPHYALLLNTFSDDPAVCPYSTAIEPLRDIVMFEGPTWPEDQPRHQLLGYPHILQGDALGAAAYAEREHLGRPHPHFNSRESAEQAAQWRLLWQIDSEDDLMLGDAGEVYVTIRETDLRARRFDRARIVWHSH